MSQKQRQLTRAQAWRAIGNKLLNARRIRDGLCVEVHGLRDRGRISEETWRQMDNQLREHLEAARDAGILVGMYLYSRAEYDEWQSGRGRYYAERAMGCYWLALEAAEEEKQT